MTTLDLVFGIILLVAAVFLVIAVLMQSGKSHNLSGAIAGGAETFFGKEKGKTMDKMFSKLTTVVAIVFVLLVIVVYVIQDDTDFDAMLNDYLAQQTTVDTSADSDAAIEGETEAAEGETEAAEGETEAAEGETEAAEGEIEAAE